MPYNNAQFRSILQSFGFLYPPEGELTSPISDDNSPMVDWVTTEAIKEFQAYYKLKVDGIAGPRTLAKAEQAMRILQDHLNRVVNANLPTSQPLYGPRTTAAVTTFQGRYGFSPAKGFAALPVRQKLYDLVRGQGVRAESVGC
ncbi:MAG: peptidoglycan-binding protein [Myxacorys californica WJT36-NPBG1]|nr:peptidoglycan-binding protein [Myxacorys californica WJT36-NPBG1]